MQAKGHAEMDANGTITAVIVDSPGSGYSHAPGVALHNGTLFDPAALNPGGSLATAKSSLSITSIVVNNSGADYKSAPTVTITDPTGSGASATAMIDNGVISAIEVTKPGSGYVTAGGIRKFVDGLPRLTEAGANNLGQYLPIAVPDTTSFPGTDYYVIALVQYREQMHSDLPPTLLREYVQLSTTEIPGKQVALQTDLLDGTQTPTLMPNGSQAYGVDDPHFLGPVIVAQKDRAVRITFYNLLPNGADGDLFMPVDSSFMGSGMGPDPMMDPYDPRPTTGGTVMDEVRNPLCNEAPKDGTKCFVDNRATLHLHGGITPWISDGTPHQWITPAEENTPWPEGVSVQNVPDMVGIEKPAGVPDCSDPYDGCSTFYYTNQQSARLMFYHDHAWGITRLNVYAGEAAGYLIQDPTEKALVDSGIIPADQIPLVIQDRTFVPDDAQMYDQYDANGNIISYGQDPTWDASRWGGKGSLWYQHVYMPAQNPGDPSGMSAYGRWMYGPWFWPPADPKYGPIDNPYFDPSCNLDDPATWQYDTDPFCEPALIPGTPNNSAGMEQFNDTPIVNGTAYPTTTVEPKAYRLRILNAANDRFWNLQWYVADSTGTEVALNAAEVAAAQTDPNIFPTPDTAQSPAGPSWIQIGTEGGFLPAPVVVPNQPITWITDPTRFDVGNVDKHSLLVAPAERADVIVDFSQYAGQTLILYNDAPAAFPARVASYDYYTGAPDLSPVGAPTILPGYGPNTRTIMQVKVASGSSPAFNLSALKAAFRHHADGSGVFESGQHPIIVGQAAYNSAYGTSFASGAWCNSPSNPSAKCDGFARISEQGGDMFKFDTLSGNKVSIPLEPKAIHDEMNAATFDEFGRMTANLGVEAVPSNPGGQNINLMPYVFPPTEVIDATNLPKNAPMTDPNTGDITMTPIGGIAIADGTQIWKITHNGVDTHPIHWHLYDLQVLNRVTWDNIIIPPEPSELGWKDTVRISPLEDTIVALRPIIPWLPFEIPNSVRELSPMMPDWNGIMPDPLAGTNDVGVIASATIADAFGLGIPPSSPQGEPIDIFNHIVNFGWEYVFHCHILSHEEMDMMHPVLVALPPKPPVGLAFDTGTNTLTWIDDSITETAFVVEKLVAGVWTQVDQQDRTLGDANVAGEVLNYQDLSFVAGDQYRVLAQNTVGDTWDYANNGNELVPGTYAFPVVTAKSEYAYIADVSSSPAAPSGLTATAPSSAQVDLAWMDNATNEDGFVVERSDYDSVSGVWSAFTQVGDTAAANVTTFSDTTVAPVSTYQYRVYAFNANGNSLPSNVAEVTTPDVPPAAPTVLMTTAVTSAQVDLAWTDNSGNEDGFVVQRSTDGGTTWNQAGQTAVDVATFSDTAVVPGSSYLYQVYAFNANGNSLPSNNVQADVPNVVPADPTNLAATSIAATQVGLAWTDNANNEDEFRIERSDDGGTNWNQVGQTAANVTTFSDTGLLPATSYMYRVYAFNMVGYSANPTNAITVTTTTGNPPAAPSNLVVSSQTQSSLTLSWMDNSNNENGFRVQIATDKNFSQNFRTVDVAAGVTSYQFTLLAPNTKYYLRVAAFNNAGLSAWSPTLADKTLK
ncbi:MAG: fibronectin type III domain-containing protein [Anaerolineales bacterium]